MNRPLRMSKDKMPQKIILAKSGRTIRAGPQIKRDDRIEALGVLISHPNRFVFKNPGVTKGQLVPIVPRISDELWRALLQKKYSGYGPQGCVA